VDGKDNGAESKGGSRLYYRPRLDGQSNGHLLPASPLSVHLALLLLAKRAAQIKRLSLSEIHGFSILARSLARAPERA